MLKKATTSINRAEDSCKSETSHAGRFLGARAALRLGLLCFIGWGATLAPAEELVISNTRVATAGMSGGFQCANGPSIYYNPQIIQAASCSLNTLTYTYGGRRVGMFDFDLSGIPEDADIEGAFVRLHGVCCYGSAEWFELSMMPGIGSFNTSVANQVYDTPGEIVPHPPHNPEPGHGDYPVDLGLMDSIRSGSNWLLIGIDRSGSFTNLASSATLHVTYLTGPPCDADVNDDDVVDGGDLSLILGYWGAGNSAYDLDENGVIDGADLAIVLGNWGDCPEGD